MPVYVHQKCLEKCGVFDKCFICRNNIIAEEIKIPLNTELLSSVTTRRRGNRISDSNTSVDVRVSCWPRCICDLFHIF